MIEERRRFQVWFRGDKELAPSREVFADSYHTAGGFVHFVIGGEPVLSLNTNRIEQIYCEDNDD